MAMERVLPAAASLSVIMHHSRPRKARRHKWRRTIICRQKAARAFDDADCADYEDVRPLLIRWHPEDRDESKLAKT